MSAESIDASTQYLLDEYEHIAEAHFKTMDTLSTFFRHYLVIMSVPITLAVGLFSFSGAVDLRLVALLGGLGLGLLALVGCCVFVYLLNLRMDVVLYARTINGLRRYFYDRLDEPAQVVVETSVLPRATNVPKYHEVAYFYPIIISLLLIDTAYLLASVVLVLVFFWLAPYAALELAVTPLHALVMVVRGYWPWLAVVLVLAVALHLLTYRMYADNREGRYLQLRGVGVDIDGVLSDHRPMFCEVLAKHTDKDLNPDAIVAIPVHDCPELDVTSADEVAVFNDPEYWTQMQALPGAASAVTAIKEDLGYHVHLFTRRDWPKTEVLGVEESAQVERAWLEATLGKPHDIPAIDWITRRWLADNHFPNCHLVIEKDGDSAVRNTRFLRARKIGLRVFVEDDPSNARRLASICDLVLLMRHPYNADSEGLPKNVVPVADWDEVLDMVSRLP